MNNKKLKKILLLSIKVAIGSSAALGIAEFIGLKYASSAGGIALLTIMGTKWETLRLSVVRILTFFFTIILMGITVFSLNNEVAAYGIFIFFLIFLCESIGFRSAVSVNAVIATHFITRAAFGTREIFEEFLLVIIGVSIAIIVNLFNNNRGTEKEMIKDMRYTEGELKTLLGAIASYLLNYETDIDLWKRVVALENDLKGYISDAYEYKNNTLKSHADYYINYFELRLEQCILIHNLHYEMKKIRKMPIQAHIIADYIIYMSDYVVEMNDTVEQIEKLEQIFDRMKNEPLPKDMDEFESRAILYHILMGIEDFVKYEKRFVENMDDTQRQVYWQNNK
jgi:uncharacterized membrane protein YgaE (UPF0421/DUF939 family)